MSVCVQVLLVSPSWLSSIPCVLPTIAIPELGCYGYGVAVEESSGTDGHAGEQVDTIAKRLMSNEGKVGDSLSTPHPPPGSDCFGKGRGTDSGG